MTHDSLCANIQVTVVYAQPDWVWERALRVSAGTTVEQAYDQSGFAQTHPGLARKVNAIGVFGQRCARDHPLENGDRVEMYRALHFDPKESRRRRALHKKRVRHANGSV